jgi:hypothetical protein
MFWWPRAESNHRHADFQSAALPTELLGRLLLFFATFDEDESIAQIRSPIREKLSERKGKRRIVR